ncbi:MAG: LytTR family transcriptional regulator DNA-binding domain-containing protein [Lachnospiraceae bacterium]|nr:LytTR family transcriptional regulator DNA-binding domain-containing protein [Lachnospiraceae bacterium]
MKIRIEQIKDGEEEVILRYREKTREIEELLSYLNKRSHSILCKKDGEDVLVRPRDVIYLESVDGTTYAYTEGEVYQAGLSLAGAEAEFSGAGFFRCSKSMVINVYHIEKLKSEAGNRIDAVMTGGEHVIISRRYAKALRRLLRGNE